MQPVCNYMKVPRVYFAWSLHQQFAWNTINATEIYYSMLISMQNSWQLNSKMQKLLVSAFWCAATPFWLSCIWQNFWGTKLALGALLQKPFPILGNVCLRRAGRY